MTFSDRLHIMVAMAYGAKQVHEIEEPSVVEWFWVYSGPAMLPAIGMGMWLGFALGLSEAPFGAVVVAMWLAGTGLMYLLPVGVTAWTTLATAFLLMSLLVAGFWGIAIVFGGVWGMGFVFDVDIRQVVSPVTILIAASLVGVSLVAVYWTLLYRRAGRVCPKDFFITADARSRDSASQS